MTLDSGVDAVTVSVLVGVGSTKLSVMVSVTLGAAAVAMSL